MKGPESTTTTLLRNGRMVLPERVAEQANLLIQGGRIAGLYLATENLPKADATIDVEGLTLFPGFIDVHIHGAVGVDTMAADASDLLRVSQFLATRGVTGWLPTLVPGPVSEYQRAINAINEAAAENSGARILGVHYEGPFVNTAQCGALRSDFFRKFSGPSDLNDLPVLTGSGKHLMTMAPEVEGGVELVRELSRRGWVASIGHTRADWELLDQAFAAGARHMTHFMNAMPSLHHRSPGPVGWGLSRDDVTCDFIADGLHLDPEMLRLLVKLKDPQSLTLISDAIAAAGLKDGPYQIWGETITVENGRTLNAKGSIAGSVITMLEAVRMMLSLGVSEVQVAQMASANPARLLGLDDMGTIEEGTRADLVALDTNGAVRVTLVDGVSQYHLREQMGAV